MTDDLERCQLIEELRSVIGEKHVVDDADVVAAHSRDRTPIIPTGTALALVRPADTDQVSAVVRWAREHRVPLVPRGEGSGLAGGANAVDGCVILSTERMMRIGAVDTDNMVITVQPGVTNETVKKRAREVGLRYPPDPASSAFSSIGGNIATNAGGLCCLKDGVTGDYVMALEVVLGTGEVVGLRRPTRKDVAGYDLASLVAGSEGTLGIVTEATLRLVPDEGKPATVVGFFANLEDAAKAVAESSQLGFTPSAMEIMDSVTLAAVEKHAAVGIPEDTEALLMAQVGRPAGESAADLADTFHKWAQHVVVSSDEFEAEQLFEIRKLAYPALEHLGIALLDDVAVPIAEMPGQIRMIHETAERHELLIATFGHAGEGNLHPTIVFEPQDSGAQKRAMAAFEEIVTAAVDFGGTVSGEHGVGILKRDMLSKVHTPAVAQLHAGIKRQFDPDGILNPGKSIVGS